jgi:hypothetical protein
LEAENKRGKAMEKTCKFCGGVLLYGENSSSYFECGTRKFGDKEWGESVECLSRQLADSKALFAESLKVIHDYAQEYGCVYCGLGHGDTHCNHEPGCKAKLFLDKIKG